MNIQSRLKKLEDKTNIGEGFCQCKRSNTEIYQANLGADSNDPTPHLISPPIPDSCSDCGKPIEKQQIIIQGVDHTTKDRFPEEWSANR